MAKLAATPTARNLIRVFFLQERLKGLGGKDSGIRRVHVVGAGVMGGDIAAWSAYKGFEVTLHAIASSASSTRALARAQDAVREEGARTKRSAPAVAARLQGRPRRRRQSPTPTS